MESCSDHFYFKMPHVLEGSMEMLRLEIYIENLAIMHHSLMTDDNKFYVQIFSEIFDIRNRKDCLNKANGQ